MKFVTEDDLRELYKKEPFTNYKVKLGEKLTPGAHQFLSDRAINLFSSNFEETSNSVNAKKSMTSLERKKYRKNKMFYSKVKSIQALFLLTAEELLNGDVLFAQAVAELGEQLCNIKNTVEGKPLTQKLSCKECTGINSENFCIDIDECFEVTEFHMKLEKGREILILNWLRCSLYEMEAVVLEFYEDSEENTVCEEVIKQVNQMINYLSQMICAAMGAKQCQRKS
jgi:ethanolamine utilization cobalamin adenosyltransferase